MLGMRLHCKGEPLHGITRYCRVTKVLCLDERATELIDFHVSDLLWFVAHTRPRCEKKLVEYCTREGFSSTLPTFRSVHKYRGKTAVFHKPLFPGYLFLR